MNDWQNIDIKDLVFDVEVEHIQEAGTVYVFPVRVRLKDETPLFTQNVTLRSEFYRELKKTNGWQEALMQIIRARLREEFFRRKKQEAVSIEDRLQLLNQPPATLH